MSVPPKDDHPPRVSRPIDRDLPIYRDDPVISRLSDDDARALANLMARLAGSVVRRRMAQESDAAGEAGAAAILPTLPRKRPPSRLATREAPRQADDEIES